jgi:hypothetical protein
MFARASLAVAMVLVAPAAYAVGEPVNGFPNWAERVEHEWTNRARVEPSIEMVKCGARCGEAACYSPKPPLYWNEKLNRAARFHSIHMKTNSYFAHNSNCVLNTSLNTTYPTSCNGAAACSCSGAGSTSPSTRTGIFGASYSGEIIATPSDPNSSFYLWLYENSTSTTCAFSSANGHRWLILTSGSGAVGYGVDGYSTGDFGSGSTPYKIPSGSHYPRSGANVELWANWYDTAAPTTASVNINGTCYAMTRQRGTATNGAWSYTATGLTGCNRYYFSFKDSTGATIDYPSTGSLGIGDTTCADFATTKPAACGSVVVPDTGVDTAPPPDTAMPDTAVADTFVPPADTSVAMDTTVAIDTSTPVDTAPAVDTSVAIDTSAPMDTAMDPDTTPPIEEDGGLVPPVMEEDATTPPTDTGTTTTPPSDDSGTTAADPTAFEGSCGCATPRSAPTPWLLGLLLIVLRRRR